MKRFLTLALAVASVGVIASSASATDTYVDGDSANGIGSSRHNLGAFSQHVGATDLSNPEGPLSGNVLTGTSEICVFCHTPHHTNTAVAPAPLWNRGNMATTFTAYGTTIGGTTIANGDIGSVSLACLSCHDGTTTFDNLVNTPGKGGTSASDRGFSFSEVTEGYMTSSRLNIGTDLSNDHPMSVTYSDDRASLRPTSTVINSIDLTTGLGGSATDYDGGNLTKNLWAVKGYIKATATIGDLLRAGKVECSSCHDPHFNNKSWNEVDVTWTGSDLPALEFESNGLFLRRVGGNTGSGVCRTCHNK
jgi:hypothetical protein